MHAVRSRASSVHCINLQYIQSICKSKNCRADKMLAEYRIRREARLLVANRLTAIANDTIKSTNLSSVTTLPTLTTQTQTQFESKAPAEVKTLAPTQAKNVIREVTPQPNISKRSVETQTSTKHLPPIVSFSLNSNEAKTSSSRAIRHTAQSTIITSTNNVEEMENETSPIGCYTNWNKTHATIASAAWCCIGDLMAFCDKYEFRALGLYDTKTHQLIVMEVKVLLSGVSLAPFDARRRFPTNIRNAENLWVCIDRCPSVEYHLKRILSIFRRPLASLPADKQRAAMQTFHLAINELRLDISARISEVHLYDRAIFEREFHLFWADTPGANPRSTASSTTTTNNQLSYWQT